MAKSLRQIVNILIGLSMFSLSSCAFQDAVFQTTLLDELGSISGTVTTLVDKPAPTYAQLLRIADTSLLLTQKSLVDNDKRYVFNASPGTYLIHFFVDTNKDGFYQPNEPASYAGFEQGQPTEIRLNKRQNVRLNDTAIRQAINPLPYTNDSNPFANVEADIGKVARLSHPRFLLENARKSVWRPLDYVATFGAGLYFLQDYDPNKTPIIFVHGMFGSAIEFESLINTLDPNHYQAWVLQYPSGLRLDMVSDFLYSAITDLQSRLGFSSIILVGHSMGGLVARSFVMAYSQQKPPYAIDAVVTINSPMLGMESVTSGLKNSPIILPVWRDLEPNSEFLIQLHAWRWPADIPYHLVYSAIPGEQSDGVVAITSQLTPKLQQEAATVQRYQAQHAKILQDQNFIAQFNALLND